MIRRGLAAVLVGAAALFAGPAHASPEGAWISQGGDTKVHIARCAAALCGTVIWQRSPGNDTRNPDPAKRSRPVVGIQMLYGMAPAGGSRWTAQYYDFRSGRTTTATIDLQGGSMKLSGCAVGALFCSAQTWTRSN